MGSVCYSTCRCGLVLEGWRMFATCRGLQGAGGLFVFVVGRGGLELGGVEDGMCWNPLGTENLLWIGMDLGGGFPWGEVIV